MISSGALPRVDPRDPCARLGTAIDITHRVADDLIDNENDNRCGAVDYVIASPDVEKLLSKPAMALFKRMTCIIGKHPAQTYPS